MYSSALDVVNSSKVTFIGYDMLNLNTKTMSSRDWDKKEDEMKVIGTIKYGIELRNKTVHKATKIKMPHEFFQIGLFLAVLQFAAVIQEIYNRKTISK